MAERVGFELAVPFATDSAFLPGKLAFLESKPTTAALGLRIGEVLALRVSDVDLTRGIVRVRQSVDAATRTVQALKSTASSSDVPMPSHFHKNSFGEKW